MKFFPLFWNMASRQILVVGEGNRAMRKLKLLLRADLDVSVAMSAPDAQIEAMLRTKKLKAASLNLESDSLKQFDYIVLALEDQSQIDRLYESAKALGKAVHIAGDDARSDFLLPAMEEVSGLTLAVSSGLSLPGKAKRFINRISRLIKDDEAQATAPQTNIGTSTLKPGEVALVGAGPGAPELLTIAAYQMLQQADVVVFDRLVSNEIVALIPSQTLCYSVGKNAGFHSVQQQDINALLVDFAKQGQKVLRLKGGDNFIFGRGGEELQELISEGISFQVVPGITAASGCSSYAGIPLTHRDYAQSVSFVTGHPKKDGSEIDWSRYAFDQQTLVVYMGRLQAPTIQKALIEHGRDPQTPIAIVERGTRIDQRVSLGVLEGLDELAKHAESPALLIIGEVVSLQQDLDWYQQA
ncbi:uroporphyrinogen-III C-methyltransferase [Alginatibacterium sediminis]|uniref:Uroporphyrinogen-III C-methyltransferase n=1 Tax=Alginatibacterium sediminis TaxID=2164068 RepID=A0A420E8Q9_9ALTE|nr:uroporphyrinogen-III C-methyltransferase [Alginatibacterium sediminis]RKF15869.1 uroporphyrinogen-III C-methyltransferase [Alginatibacterium sediminis]